MKKKLLCTLLLAVLACGLGCGAAADIREQAVLIDADPTDIPADAVELQSGILYRQCFEEQNDVDCYHITLPDGVFSDVRAYIWFPEAEPLADSFYGSIRLESSVTMVDRSMNETWLNSRRSGSIRATASNDGGEKHTDFYLYASNKAWTYTAQPYYLLVSVDSGACPDGCSFTHRIACDNGLTYSVCETCGKVQMKNGGKLQFDSELTGHTGVWITAAVLLLAGGSCAVLLLGQKRR